MLTSWLQNKGSWMNNKIGDICLNAGRKGGKERGIRRKQILVMKEISNNLKRVLVGDKQREDAWY